MQLCLVAPCSRRAMEEVQVWIHGLRLPEVRPLHRRQDAVLQETHNNNSEFNNQELYFYFKLNFVLSVEICFVYRSLRAAAAQAQRLVVG